MTKLYPSKAELEAAFSVARGAKIPQMPDVILALRQELGRAEPDIAAASSLIAQDLAITGKLLKTINSPAFNLGAKVASVQQAASLMGLKRLGSLVTAEAVSQILDSQSGSARVIWESILEEARAMALITQVVPDLSSEEAYLFGMLHDIGCLIFASSSADYGSMWSLHSNSTPRELLDYEKRSMGVEHTILGFLLARHWQLPDYIAVAICHHHRLGSVSTDEPKVAQLIAIAKLGHFMVAHAHGTEDMPDMRDYREDAWHELDITEEDWRMLSEKARQGALMAD